MALFSIRARWRSAFNRWLDRRIPPAHRVRLDQKRIFILPTRFGYLYLLITALLFLVGVNYSNSLAFALSFFLLSLFLVAIFETFRNLAGLEISAQRAGQGHVGEDIGFALQLEGARARSLQLAWPEAPIAQADLLPERPLRVQLFFPAKRRGWLRPGRFRVSSQFPLGLLEAWSWVDLDLQALVFPRPQASPLPAVGWVSGEGQGPEVSGLDDFVGFKRYQKGDAISQIAWKQQAKGGQLLTKQFASREDARFWLRWQQTSGPQEQRLQVLCHWVLEAERQHQAYGLDLPGFQLSPGLGASQRQQSLKALALFPGAGGGDAH